METNLALIPADSRRVFVAFSGGLDSSVLLHLLATAEHDFELVPWHVNHGLLDIADSMESFCREQSARYDLQPRVDRLDMANVDSNIEAEARQRRYALFARECVAGDVLLTAHHADDQAETLLLNLLRGSGASGLRGIASRRTLGEALLLRPLLRCSREELETYARQHELAWFNDPSNADLRFDRNYLRNQVVPLFKSRWPHWLDAVNRSCELQSETHELLETLARADFRLCRGADVEGLPTVEVEALLELPQVRCRNLLRYWLGECGFAALPQARLSALLSQLHARPDAMPRIDMPDYSIRLYDRRLFAVPDTEPAPGDAVFEFGKAPQIDIEQLDLHLTRADVLARINVADQGQQLSLRFGRGDADSKHRLKRLFQKHRVPPWRRATTPLVFLDDRLEGLLT